MEFQSLVGTLKTRKINGTRSMNLPVSIPCRYAKNASGAVHIHGQNLVSIPCRYAKNDQGRRIRVVRAEFQSLVGTLKTTLLS